jgi:squalene synthase HpnC
MTTFDSSGRLPSRALTTPEGLCYHVRMGSLPSAPRDFGLQAEKTWGLEESYAHCEQLARTHYENFPVGSWLLPADKRKYLWAIYAFARTADDFADEAQYLDNLRLPLLENWEGQLLQCMWRKPQHPVFIALKDTIETFRLPVEPFQDLLMAFKMDVFVERYKTYDDLLGYCRLSANPVGQLVLSVFGYRDPALHELSDAICTALQLTNHWQDIAIDAKKPRIYVPIEDMDRHGYDEARLQGGVADEAFRRMMADLVNRTRALFVAGRPLLDRVGRDLAFELRLVWHGGSAILDRIESGGYDVFRARPTLGLGAKAILLTKAALLSRRQGSR